MKLLFNILLTLMILAVGAYGGWKILQTDISGYPDPGHAHSAHNDTTSGRHGGRLLEQDNLQLEITIHEHGTPPEFRVYAYKNGRPLSPDDVSLRIQLHRLGGKADRISFKSQDEYLVSEQVVREPHSFDVNVTAEYKDRSHEWNYAQHEGRTRIPLQKADTAGIETATADSAEIQQTLLLQGRVKYDPKRVRQVRARYPGMLLAATKSIGERVRSGEPIARVESNDSLQSYAVKAPIDGVVVEQHVTAGEVAGDKAIYVIASLDRVWVDLAVFRKQLSRVQTGQLVYLRSLNGEHKTRADIGYLLPVSDAHSQSTTARVYLDNPDGLWQPGMAVTGKLITARKRVPLAVRNSALQKFRDFDVVYARFGDTYEVRMLELGRRDDTYTEVLSGLEPGTEYVVSNSYLLKADIEKSGVSHSH